MSETNSEAPAAVDYEEFMRMGRDYGSGGPALGTVRATARMLDKINPSAAEELFELVGRGGVTGQRKRIIATAYEHT
jgi:hypothetical protein